MSRGSAGTRALQLLTAGVLAWGLWHLLGWGLWRAEFRPDAAACQALAHAGACWGVVSAKAGTLLWGLPHDGAWWQPASWQGLPLTLGVGLVSYVCSWPLAVALALARRSHWRALAWSASAVIETVRGAPLVIWLFMAAFLLPRLLPTPDSLSLAARVMLVMSVFSAAYLAEVCRAGLQTVPAAQREAADTLGLGWVGTQWRIVWPQALRNVLPALTSHAIGLLKDTSLITIVGLHELTGGLGLSLGGDPVWRPFYFEAYLFIGAVYALMCTALAALGRWLEARWPAIAG